jgi:hypothetical protein
MRYLFILTSVLAFLLVAGCGSEDTVKILRSDPDDGLPDAKDYFQFADGDVWYYTYTNETGSKWKVRREAVPNVQIQGVNTSNCTEIFENGEFFECWSMDSYSFKQHFLGVRFAPSEVEVLSVDPVLEIPLDLRSDEPYYFNSMATDIHTPLIHFTVTGYLIFDGYSTHTVNAGTFDNCMTLLYTPLDARGNPDRNSPDAYREYYAPNVGLIDNGDIVLDSAFINDIRYPR